MSFARLDTMKAGKDGSNRLEARSKQVCMKMQAARLSGPRHHFSAACSRVCDLEHPLLLNNYYHQPPGCPFHKHLAGLHSIQSRIKVAQDQPEGIMQSDMENAASAAAQNEPFAASQNESEIKVFTAAETQPVIPAREYHLGVGVHVRSLMLNLSLYRISREI